MKKPSRLKRALLGELSRKDEKARRAAFEQRQADEAIRSKLKANASKGRKGKGKAVEQDRPGTAHDLASGRPSYNPYRNGDAVLFVGEGNFSFALSWATKYPASAKLSIATSYDSREVAMKKYSDLVENVDKLQELGVAVLFDVDAQKLEKTKPLKSKLKNNSLRFDKVVFHFPHVGLGEKDEERNVRLNQMLLLRFLKSVKPFLKEGSATLDGLKRRRGGYGGTSSKRRRGNLSDDEAEELPSDPESLDSDEDGAPAGDERGSVLITLFTCKPYNLWTLPSLAKNGPKLGSAILPFPESRDAASAQPVYRVERSFAFSKNDWPGYDHRRTIGHRGAESASLLDREHAGARTWELILAEQAE